MAQTNLTFQFSSARVSYRLDTPFAELEKWISKDHAFVITDEHVFKHHKKKFKGWNTIVLQPGEKYKVQETVNGIIHQLIQMGADRNSWLIGVGGGVVTDITGYVAGIYMRGLQFALVPTSLLAMVDASIGGKNGVDVGVYKNMVGLIRQPSILLFDMSFLQTLPKAEWRNGFAEIIKHAAIKDAKLFKLLQQHTIAQFKKDKVLLSRLIKTNVLIKTKVVLQDETEKADRKLLNFGHTLGHAIENQYALSHGEAISIGMTYAALLSEQMLGFTDANALIELLTKYGLPTRATFDWKTVTEVLMKDKKNSTKGMQYILLKKIGRGVVEPIPVQELINRLRQLL
ncbi:MAG: 3-dehydroquinate synthase [Chitinophagia bacterium]|nr:3-dehydroquinate synthase [Chitinophagia bacterium]